jgi:peptide/nickel transport system permease protein
MRKACEPGTLAACLFVLVTLGAIVAGPWIVPFSIVEFHPEHVLEGPSLAFPFGTDEFGRDVFSRVIAGARPTLLVALASAVAGVALGTVTGLTSGYLRGPTDELIMRVMDALMSFPGLVLAMLVVVVLGPSAINVVVALTLVFWPRSARLVRSVVMEIGSRAFVQAARSRGESVPYILLRELLPNVWMIVSIDLSLRVTSAILLAAALAYLGIGVTAPTPAWGLMVHDGQPFMQIAPWLIVFPCVAIAGTSVGTVLLGERLRRTASIPGGGRAQ